MKKSVEIIGCSEAFVRPVRAFSRCLLEAGSHVILLGPITFAGEKSSFLSFFLAAAIIMKHSLERTNQTGSLGY
jgi:hypothetical protein